MNDDEDLGARRRDGYEWRDGEVEEWEVAREGGKRWWRNVTGWGVRWWWRRARF